jgi:SnoaL-like domain
LVVGAHERLSGLVQRYVEAWESRSVDLMVAVLAEDVTFAMPPFPHWFSGRDTVTTFTVATAKPPLRYVLTRAGGQPAVGWYVRRAPRDVYLPTSIEVLALEGERVKEVTAFASPSLFPVLRLAGGAGVPFVVRALCSWRDSLAPVSTERPRTSTAWSRTFCGLVFGCALLVFSETATR